jgi:hypothetical protein
MPNVISETWRAVCGENRTHGSEGARDGQPSCATLQQDVVELSV